MAKFVRVIDTKRCMGCRACVAACAAENHFVPGAPWNVMIEYEMGSFPAVKKVFNTMGCMHCDQPACKTVCDSIGVRAISKNEFGIVLIDYEKCIGCGYCNAICPYGVPQYNAKTAELYAGKGKTAYEAIPYAQRDRTHRKKAKTYEKCTFCWHKLQKAVADGKLDRVGKDQEYTPACDLVCPVQARTFGDIEAPDSAVAKKIKESGAVQLKKSFRTGPQVYYVLEEGAES